MTDCQPIAARKTELTVTTQGRPQVAQSGYKKLQYKAALIVSHHDYALAKAEILSYANS